MTEKQESKFIEILSHFVTAQNCIMEMHWNEYKEHFKIGSDIFKEHFSNRPQNEIEEIFEKCRSLYSQWTHTSYMGTFTVRREMWSNLLKNNK